MDTGTLTSDIMHLGPGYPLARPGIRTQTIFARRRERPIETKVDQMLIALLRCFLFTICFLTVAIVAARLVFDALRLRAQKI
ncbi:hypothetical protein [Phaeovulum sp.]|uniref:hypothetical protein n=1 Tax=Phaeovulum sp. TaxID=2934796 RepID=UPI0039E30730